jgi:Undecaprenyl-phosphate glucose phosphotransferase
VGAGAVRLGLRPASRHRSGADGRTLAEGLVRLGDLAVVALSGLLATKLRFAGAGQPDTVTAALLLGLLLAGGALSVLRIYDLELLARPSYQLPRLLAGWTAAIGAVLVVLYGFKAADDLSRLWVAYWYAAGAAGFVAWRLVARRAIGGALASGRLRRTVFLVGDGDVMSGFLARLGRAAAEGGCPRVAGALVLGGRPPSGLPEGCRPLFDPASLERAVSELRADQVVLTLPLARGAEIAALAARLRRLPVEIGLYSDLADAGLPVAGLTRLADAPVFQLARRPLDGWSYLLKGLEDRILALALLALAAPVLAAVAAAVRLSSPGPVLYRQVRRGFNREPIVVFKFRTMRADRCDAPDAAEVRQATRDDPRVTPVGRFLRRTSLDELPQLYNVLRGEMSLVGPRPHALAHDDYYVRLIDGYLGRQRVKPGITGWAQVNGCRGETRTLEEMRRRVELDLEYIEGWSLLLDLRILLRTASAGFGGGRAY